MNFTVIGMGESREREWMRAARWEARPAAATG